MLQLLHYHTIDQLSVCAAGTKEVHNNYRDPITSPNEAYGMHSASSVTQSHAQQTSSAVPGPMIVESQMYELMDK